jgi:hypothetical protein
MICERCGETFVTEQYGDLCEACQKQGEQEQQQHKPPSRRRAAEEI